MSAATPPETFPPSEAPPRAPAPVGPSVYSERVFTFSVLAFLLLLYIPFTGSYGLWDPWETHYGEVGRQMVARGDWISLWWPGSPQDPASGQFWSKPVLTFWLMAISLKLFGLGHASPAYFHEMTVGWRAEWALRLPFVLLGIAGVWATYELLRRLVSRRAGLLGAMILATASQWALITRQAMTDMAFVVPMTVAMLFAGLALIPPAAGPADPTRPDPGAPLPRRERRFGKYLISWPHAPAFYGFLALYALCAVPQLVVNLIQLKPFPLVFGGRMVYVVGQAAMLPFVLLFFYSLYGVTQATTRRSIYLFTAYLMGAIATLAKGPAGIALPILSVLLFLVFTGRLAELFGMQDGDEANQKPSLALGLKAARSAFDGLELGRGALVFLCVGAPWYVAMICRHGMPFWMELIGDNYVHRAQGRHGDRGTYEYYLRQLGAGLFPWSGIVAGGVLSIGRYLRDRTASTRAQLAALALAWFVVDFAVVTVVNTKFHHYILPALPALAILGALFLDELFSLTSAAARAVPQAILLLVGVPLTYLSGRDLSNFPARIGWLFNYDYVNVPINGRPWPLTSLYGQRYEYGDSVWAFVLVATAAVLFVALWGFRTPQTATPAPEPESWLPSRSRIVLGGTLFFALLLAAGLTAPSPELVATYSSSKLPADTLLPLRLRLGFLVPAAVAALWLIMLGLRRLGFGRLRLLLLGAVAIGWTTWVLDRFMVDISPHWSQKHVFATYFRLRSGPEEPILAWMMYWRGENFYTCNQIYDHRIEQSEKTAFCGDKNVEKMQAYFSSHRGKRVYFLIERHRLDSLRGLLPEEARKSLEVVDESNNKVYLARAQL